MTRDLRWELALAGKLPTKCIARELKNQNSFERG